MSCVIFIIISNNYLVDYFNLEKISMETAWIIISAFIRGAQSLENSR